MASEVSMLITNLARIGIKYKLYMTKLTWFQVATQKVFLDDCVIVLLTRYTARA